MDSTTPSPIPSHDDRPPASPWQQIADRDDFRSLIRAKIRFIVAGTIFFLVYYFALPILTGYWPDLMSRKVGDHFSLAYLFALSQFPMAWLLAAAYVRAASKFDRDAAAIISESIPAKATSRKETPSA
jgi:uncharacterized membrane protein (DUF485 family)